MKKSILAVAIPALLAAGLANAAEVYNKNGNKLDLYGKVDGLHYSVKMTPMRLTVTSLTSVLASRGFVE